VASIPGGRTWESSHIEWGAVGDSWERGRRRAGVGALEGFSFYTMGGKGATAVFKRPTLWEVQQREIRRRQIHLRSRLLALIWPWTSETTAQRRSECAMTFPNRRFINP
jgi:hypothetical protein